MNTPINPNQSNNGITPSNYFTQNFNYPGYPYTSGATDPMMTKYFSRNASSSGDGYQNNNPLGLPESYNAGNNYNASSAPGSSSTSDTTTLARFQGLAYKLDTQVNASKDDKIDVKDLSEALHDTSGKYKAEDKQVIQSMMDNAGGMRGRVDHLDGKDDGIITIDSINKMVVNPNAEPEKVKTPEEKMSNTEAFNVMADYIGTAIHNGHSDKYVDKHGKLIAPQRGSWSTDRSKLQRMSEDEKVPEKVRTAAKKLLTNKKLFKTADTGHNGGNPDGKISLKDFQEAIKKNADIDDIKPGDAVDKPVDPTKSKDPAKPKDLAKPEDPAKPAIH